MLGPRLAPTTVERLRRLVCPATAVTVMLGLATDAEARFLAGLRRPDTVPEQITLLAGTYRVPERARPTSARHRPRARSTGSGSRRTLWAPPFGPVGPPPNRLAWRGSPTRRTP